MYGFWFWLHFSCAWLSATGFLLRGVWMIADSPLRETRGARVLPHVVDTVLVTSALVLAFASGRGPLGEPWLVAKFAALLAYIGFGLVAFRFGRNRPVRILAFVAAIGSVAYILTVAHLRTVYPFA
ncbi:MAG: SirB2 family protein [Pseudomonadales bacterium]|jgi:uncharacterized membrane protein SirB2|nr:SirB2 family protein [Pseudomonadales bacterium]